MFQKTIFQIQALWKIIFFYRSDLCLTQNWTNEKGRVFIIHGTKFIIMTTTTTNVT